jgi:hypothetical protein
MSGNGKSREDLTQEAFEVRSKLLHTVEELDQRRRGAADFRVQFERHARDFAMVGGVVLAVTASAVALLVGRGATAVDRRRRNRWRLAKRLWQKPERAMRAERRSFFGEIARSLLLAIVTTAVTLPARRAVAKLVDWKRENGREASAR